MVKKSTLIPLLLIFFLLGTGVGYLLPHKDGTKEGVAAPSPSLPAQTAASTTKASSPPAATATATPETNAPGNDDDALHVQVQSMTLEEKIGQMLLVGIDGTGLDTQAQSLIGNLHAGGVILYKPNITSAEQTVGLLNALREANAKAGNPAPLFLAVDEEGGRVSRLPSDYTKMPASRVVGKVNDPAFSYGIGELLGRQVSSLGFNLDFAPVLDVDSNPANPVIGDRSFGADPALVSSLGIQTMKGLQSQGVATSLKHFPGHGDTSVDSHLNLPVVNHSLERLRSLELVPFAEAVQAGADMVMAAHILLPALDKEFPASFSQPVITGLLRKELGYDGVVITDDLTMGAVTEHYTLEKAAVRAVQAGGDILLVGHGYDQANAVFLAVQEAVKTNAVSEERLNESVLRILLLKKKYGLSNEPTGKADVGKINAAAAKLLNTYLK